MATATAKPATGKLGIMVQQKHIFLFQFSGESDPIIVGLADSRITRIVIIIDFFFNLLFLFRIIINKDILTLQIFQKVQVTQINIITN